MDTFEKYVACGKLVYSYPVRKIPQSEKKVDVFFPSIILIHL
ncbi:MAG: hypothetical protein ACREBQ_09575 [Nitrososphaerales archaeon]